MRVVAVPTRGRRLGARTYEDNEIAGPQWHNPALPLSAACVQQPRSCVPIPSASPGTVRGMTLSGWWAAKRAEANRSLDAQRLRVQAQREHPSRGALFMRRRGRWVVLAVTLAVLGSAYVASGFITAAVMALALVAFSSSSIANTTARTGPKRPAQRCRYAGDRPRSTSRSAQL